jgi:hypothetical protein
VLRHLTVVRDRFHAVHSGIRAVPAPVLSELSTDLVSISNSVASRVESEFNSDSAVAVRIEIGTPKWFEYLDAVSRQFDTHGYNMAGYKEIQSHHKANVDDLKRALKHIRTGIAVSSVSEHVYVPILSNSRLSLYL